MVNDRYVGSDIDRIAQAGQVVVQTAQKGIADTGDLVDKYLSQVKQNSANLLELNNQQLQIQQQRNSQGLGGFASLVESGLKFVNQRQQQDLQKGAQRLQAEDARLKAEQAEAEWQRQLRLDEQKANQDERDFGFKVATSERDFQYKMVGDQVQQAKWLQERQDKVEEERRKQLSTVAATDAYDKIASIEGIYLQAGSGFLENVGKFKEEAMKIIAETPGLSAADYKTLIEKVNETANGRYRKFNERLISEQDKLSQANADKTEAQFNIEILPYIRQIKNLPNSEQAKPFLDGLTGKIKEFLASNNGLTDSQKLTIASRVIRNASDAYAIKLDNYQGMNKDITNFNNFALQYQAAVVEYQSSGNYSQFKERVGQLKITYGDWSSNLAQLGEGEKQALELARNNQELDQIRRNASSQAIQAFVLSDSFGNYVTANLLLNPNFESQLRAFPGLADKPEIKQAFQMAARIRESRAEFAKLGVDFAQTNTKISQLQLNKVQNLVQVTQRIAFNQRSGKPLDLADQLVQAELANYAAANPGSPLMGLLQGVFTNPDAKPDMASINAALKNEEGAISVIQQRLLQESQAKKEEFFARYSDVVQVYGGIPTDAQLKTWLTQAKGQYDAEFESIRNAAKQAESSAVPAGIQPNFNSGSSYGASIDSNGLVLVVPQSKAQVVNYNGRRVVTPTIAEGKAAVTSGWGVNRGTHRHAGVDFASTNGNHRNIALVSGTVLYSGSMRGYGGIVDILGDNGFIYRYAHQAVQVRVGDRVNPGQVVGISNNSGTNRGSGDTRHLHFEVLVPTGNAANVTPNNYRPRTGFAATIDPMKHLAELSAGGSNVRQLRVNNNRTAQRMGAIAPGNAVLAPNRGAIVNGYFGKPGMPPVPANQTFGTQRPYQTSGSRNQYSINAKQLSPDTWQPDDWGYAWLRQNPQLAQAIAATAKELRVPPWWITDIIAQESGNFRLAMKQHPGGSRNRNYGMFGFGSDSGVKGFYGAEPLTQVRQYRDYMIRNGWLKHVDRTGGNVNLAQFWAITRMGSGWRREILNGRDPASLRLNDTGKTYMDELGLLGNHVGRRYVGNGQRAGSRGNRNTGRRGRNKAVKTSYNPNSSVAVALDEAGTPLPYVDDTLA